MTEPAEPNPARDLASRLRVRRCRWQQSVHIRALSRRQIRGDPPLRTSSRRPLQGPQHRACPALRPSPATRPRRGAGARGRDRCGVDAVGPGRGARLRPGRGPGRGGRDADRGARGGVGPRGPLAQLPGVHGEDEGAAEGHAGPSARAALRGAVEVAPAPLHHAGGLRAGLTWGTRSEGVARSGPQPGTRIVRTSSLRAPALGRTLARVREVVAQRVGHPRAQALRPPASVSVRVCGRGRVARCGRHETVFEVRHFVEVRGVSVRRRASRQRYGPPCARPRD